MGLSASHHMCSVVGAQSWIKKRDGRRSNLLHKSAQHGFERNRYSAFAKIENYQINMLSFLTRVIFVSRYDVVQKNRSTDWRVKSYAGRDQEVSLWEIIKGSKQSRTAAALKLRSLSGHQQHYSKSANITPDFFMFYVGYQLNFSSIIYLSHASLVLVAPIFNHHTFLIHTRSSLNHLPTEDGIKGIRTLKFRATPSTSPFCTKSAALAT